MTEDWNRIKVIFTRFKDLTTIGFATIIANAISGLFWLYIARLIGTANYGEISYLIAIASVTTTLSFLGSGNTLIVYTAKQVKIQPAVYFTALSAASIASAILFFIFYNVGISLFVLGNVIFGLVTSELLGQKLYKKYSILLITQKIIMVGLSIGLYRLLGSEGVILGIALSFFPSSFMIYKTFKGSKIDLSTIRTRFGFIINSYILDIARVFSSSTDKLIVGPLLGFALLGNYQLGVQFLSLLGILPSLVYLYILPHDASGNPNKKLKQITILSSIVLAILGVTLAPKVVPVLFPKFTEAVGIIQIMSLSIIPTTINITFISKFLGIEKIKIVLIGSGIFLAVQIISIFVLGKVFGINGVASSFVLATASETAYLLSVNRIVSKSDRLKPQDQTTNFSSTDEKVSEHHVTSGLVTIKSVERKLEFFAKKPILSLAIIGTIGLLLRLYYFPYNVPLILDALSYFFYATDTSILGHLSSNYVFANNTWPVFLSIFFSIFHFNTALDYMTLQRAVSVSISVLTIIPVYFLCRRFFERPFAILGAAVFVFEPRIIQNSFLGLTDPLYIFLVSISLALFFSPKRWITFASFGIAALATLVRAEGLFVFFPLFIMFVIRHRNEAGIVVKSASAVAIFILVLLPMALFRFHSQGSDALTSRLVEGTNQILASSHQGGFSSYIFTSIENIVKLSGWSLVPIFIFFVPLGLYLIFRKRNLEKITILALIISMFLPVSYAFSSNADARYIYPLFPLFCLLAVLTVEKLGVIMKNRNLLLILVIGGILLASSVFLDLKKYDYEHQKEAFGIAKHVTILAGGVNDYYPEDSYIKPAEMPDKWPVLESSIPFNTIIISTDGFDSLPKYIEFAKKKGLTDIVVDGNKNRPSFLNDVFYHEEKYPYLIKIYDSQDHGYKYHVKIYKINYDAFNSLLTKSLH